MKDEQARFPQAQHSRQLREPGLRGPDRHSDGSPVSEVHGDRGLRPGRVLRDGPGVEPGARFRPVADARAGGREIQRRRDGGRIAEHVPAPAGNRFRRRRRRNHRPELGSRALGGRIVAQARCARSSGCRTMRRHCRHRPGLAARVRGLSRRLARPGASGRRQFHRGGGRHLAIRGGGSGPDLGIELDPRVFPLPARRRCRGGRAAESRAAQIAPRRPGPRISMGNAEGTDTLREGARVSQQHVGRGQPGGQVDPVAHAAAAGIRGIRPGNDDRAGHDPGRVAAPAGRSSPPHRSRGEKGARKARSPVPEDHDPAGRLARGFRRRDGRVSRPGSLRVDGRRRGRLAGRGGPQMVCRRNLFHGGGGDELPAAARARRSRPAHQRQPRLPFHTDSRGDIQHLVLRRGGGGDGLGGHEPAFSSSLDARRAWKIPAGNPRGLAPPGCVPGAGDRCGAGPRVPAGRLAAGS